MKKQIIVLAVLIVAGLSFTAYASRSQVTPKEEVKKTSQTAPISETCPPPKEVVGERCIESQKCPDGTTLVDYEDGVYKQKPICKGNPTGCPYGDSIPVDSPKCVPPTEVENTTPEYVPTPDGGMKNVETGEVFYGK